MSNLYTASNQWATRPADERFWTLTDMRAQCHRYACESRTATLPFSAIRTEARDGDLLLAGKERQANLTHYSFGQLCGLAGAPASFLRQLPATLAAQNLNHCLKERGSDVAKRDARILFHANGSLVARSINSELYDRVWNYELCDRLLQLQNSGWMVPPARPTNDDPRARPATEADIIPGQEDFGLSVKVGDMIAPAGVYASDHDMFAFLVNADRVVRAGDRALMRGIIVRNSEVGDGALKFDFFCMDNVCGNHIIWGVENVHAISIRHVGQDSLMKGVRAFRAELSKYTDASAREQEMKIERAMEIELGSNKEEILDAVFTYAKSHSLTAITRKRISAAIDTAEAREDRYGNPRTVWALVSGLTENSQADGWTDERSEVDTQAGRLMEIAF